MTMKFESVEKVRKNVYVKIDPHWVEGVEHKLQIMRDLARQVSQTERGAVKNLHTLSKDICEEVLKACEITENDVEQGHAYALGNIIEDISGSENLGALFSRIKNVHNATERVLGENEESPENIEIDRDRLAKCVDYLRTHLNIQFGYISSESIINRLRGEVKKRMLERTLHTITASLAS
jgi:hypothetical protein